MAQLTDVQLNSLSQEIKNETVEGANTELRVGTLFENLVDSKANNSVLGNYSLNTHNHTLDSLSNVTINANSSGEILKWSGTAWINNTLAEAGIQPAGNYGLASADITAVGLTTTALTLTRLDGNLTATVPIWNQNTTGSAATLTTARTINGTSFNGSANITTANWGTARTITIGSTGKSVNGSGNIAWSLGEIGAEPAFTKGGLIAGTNISLSGTLTNRLVGTGDVTINASGSDPMYLVNGYYPTLDQYTSLDADPQDARQVFYVPYTAPLLWKNNMNITSIRGLCGNGPTGALLRFGLYELTGTNQLTLVYDWGGLAGDGGGFKELTVSGTITKGKIYYMVYKRDDAVGGAIYTMGGKTFGHPYIAHNGIATNDTNSATLFKTGVAFGAFPATDTLPASGDHLYSSPLFYLNLANI